LISKQICWWWKDTSFQRFAIIATKCRWIK